MNPPVLSVAFSTLRCANRLNKLFDMSKRRCVARSFLLRHVTSKIHYPTSSSKQFSVFNDALLEAKEVAAAGIGLGRRRLFKQAAKVVKVPLVCRRFLARVARPLLLELCGSQFRLSQGIGFACWCSATRTIARIRTTRQGWEMAQSVFQHGWHGRPARSGRRLADRCVAEAAAPSTLNPNVA